jgi:HTH-type transcriptional regulator/antitoxin HipB
MLIHSANDLALCIVDQRKRSQLSQTYIGNLMGLKQATISAFENKPGSTKLETLFHILAALNLDMHIVPKTQLDAASHSWQEEW